MGRRTKSLHHNLGDKNVVFHREHRSKKGRTWKFTADKMSGIEAKRKVEKMRVKEIERYGL